MLYLSTFMLSNIKTAVLNKKLQIIIFYNKLCLQILQFLKKHGYISGYKIISEIKLKIFLKYAKNKALIINILQISTSKKKIYRDIFWIKKYTYHGWEYIFLTPKGILWNNECLFFKTSGLLLFKIL